MKKNTVSRSDLSFLVGFFLLGFTLWGQGGDLLIQQYRLSIIMINFFSDILWLNSGYCVISISKSGQFKEKVQLNLKLKEVQNELNKNSTI